MEFGSIGSTGLQTLGKLVQRIAVYQPSAGILALTFLGLLAGQNYFTHICRWAKNHWTTLKEPLGFKTKKPPNRTTISRLLAKISLTEIQ